MRSLHSPIVGLLLAYASVALAQTEKATDIAGKWTTDVTKKVNPVLVPMYETTTLTGTSILTLSPDGLWFDWRRGALKGGGWGTIESGRWRMSGDSLWLSRSPADGCEDCGEWAEGQRPGRTPYTPKAAAPDFWSKIDPKAFYLYKVELVDNQLSLSALDSLTKSRQVAPDLVYKR